MLRTAAIASSTRLAWTAHEEGVTFPSLDPLALAALELGEREPQLRWLASLAVRGAPVDRREDERRARAQDKGFKVEGVMGTGGQATLDVSFKLDDGSSS